MALLDNECHTYRFSVDEFKELQDHESKFHVVIGGKNHFTDKAIQFDLSPRENDDATISIKGNKKERKIERKIERKKTTTRTQNTTILLLL
jgi:hypothetical protein